MKNVLITGGCGFIGSNLVRYLVEGRGKEMGFVPQTVVNIDKLTYAGRTENLDGMESPGGKTEYHFFEIGIGDKKMVAGILEELEIDCVLHLAAETHVDRSIESARPFMDTNVMGTYTLLDACLRYWQNKFEGDVNKFRFIHVSTDEVFGSLGKSQSPFTEESPYQPNSPYAASKAAADHLARAYHHTYYFPVIITNCSNNFGPYQFPEKLIPLMILNALESKPLPIYGKGENVRDWLYVEDHCRGLIAALTKGTPGESYNFGGNAEKKNIELVDGICGLLDQLRPRVDKTSYKDFKLFVDDRPGHDFRYAMNTTKALEELDWKPQTSLGDGLKRTVEWYLNNAAWCRTVQSDGDERRRRGLGLV